MLVSVVIVLVSVAIAYAADIRVLVGDGGALAFTLPSITAQSGEIVIFVFCAKNHSVTQSTFAKPCSQMTTPNQGVNSGFQLVAPGSTLFPSWNITVNNLSAPLWFFCAQTVPINHCNAGMVFAINPSAEESFDAFQATTKANTTSSSGSSFPPPSPGTIPLPTETGNSFPFSNAGGTIPLPTESGDISSTSNADGTAPLPTDARGLPDVTSYSLTIPLPTDMRSGHPGVVVSGVTVLLPTVSSSAPTTTPGTPGHIATSSAFKLNSSIGSLVAFVGLLSSL